MEDRAISLNDAIKAVRHAEVNFSVQSEIDFTKHKREVQEIIDNILDTQEKALMELPPVKPQEPCEDAISRQAVLDIVDGYSESQSNVEDVTQDIISDIMVLPSVKTQEPQESEEQHKGERSN